VAAAAAAVIPQPLVLLERLEPLEPLEEEAVVAPSHQIFLIT